MATPASTLCSRGCHWEDGPAKTSTLQPLHRNGVLWGNLGLWNPCSHLLVSLANTSTALQSLVGCLPAFSTLSPFSSQMTTTSSGPWFPSPQRGPGRLPGPHSYNIPCMAKWLSGCGRSQVCHAGLGGIPKAILGFGVAFRDGTGYQRGLLEDLLPCLPFKAG